MTADSDEKSIDKLFDMVERLQADSNYGKGAVKAALVIISVAQTIGFAILAWMMTSILDLRENRAVTDYRITRIESMYDAEDQVHRNSLLRRP